MSHRAFVMAASGVLLLAGAVAAAPDRESSAERLAAPQLIVFHGGGMEREVRITDWWENLRILSGLEALDTTSMGELKRGLARRGVLPVDTSGRASVEVALFWHPVATELRARGLPKEQWPLEEANQRAQFFPATASAPAIWVWTTMVPAGRPFAKLAGPNAIEVLERHGVQVRVE